MSETPAPPDHPHTATDLLPRRVQRFATLFAAVAVGIALFGFLTGLREPARAERHAPPPADHHSAPAAVGYADLPTATIRPNVGWNRSLSQLKFDKPDVFAQFFREAMDFGGAFLTRDRADGRVIGSSRYFGYDEANSEIEIGWSFLARSHWGGKYNGEMKRLMLAHAFRFVQSVVFLIGPNNIRSQTAVRRIGAVRDGTRVNPYGLESVLFRLDSAAFG